MIISASQIFHRQKFFSRHVRFRRIYVRQIAPHHFSDNFVYGKILCGVGGNILAVAHDGHFVGNSQNFVHLVRNVNNTAAARAQSVHDFKQMLYFYARQRRGRLVKHEKFRVIRNGFGDFHHLSLRYRQGTHDHFRIYVDFKIFKKLGRIFIHFALRNQSEFRRVSSQPDIVHYVALQNLIQFLMHHRNAVFHGVFRSGKFNFFALDFYAARIFFINSE